MRSAKAEVRRASTCKSEGEYERLKGTYETICFGCNSLLPQAAARGGVLDNKTSVDPRGNLYRGKLPGDSASKIQSGLPGKMGTVEEESDESLFWLECLKELATRRHSELDRLLGEADELVSIFVTAKKNSRSQQLTALSRRARIWRPSNFALLTSDFCLRPLSRGHT
jgi:hypothetical protein